MTRDKASLPFPAPALGCGSCFGAGFLVAFGVRAE
jgi:hypothetical protein